MTTQADSDSNTQFYSCYSCPRRDISDMFSFIPQELQSRRIIHDPLPDQTRDGLDRTTVLSIDKRFVILLKFNKRHPSAYQRNQTPAEYYRRLINIDVFNLLENTLTELWSSENEVLFRGFNFTTILNTINFSRKGRFLKLNDNLLAYCSTRHQALRGPVPIFLCLISLNTETKTFEFCDLVVLNNKSLGSFGYTIDSDDCETPHLKIRFTVKSSGSTKIETHHYKVSNNRLIFMDKIVTPTCDFNPDILRYYHIFEKKAYKFRVRPRMNTHFGRRISSINYSRVYVYDLEHLQDKPERVRTHYHQHGELRNAPGKYTTDATWTDSGFMFVSIFSQSLQHFNIYRFDATSLKWDRIEWLHFSINHVYAISEEYFHVCISTRILAVTSANTLFLSSQINFEKDGQKKIHRDYYRLTVGRADCLRDLAWFKVQKSIYKHLVSKAPFNKFE